MTDEDIRLIERLADAAGDAIRPFFRRAFSTEIKPDASPVTEVDRAAEAAIRAILDAERPHDGVIGEEYGSDRADAPRIWVIDPIDGTRSFLAGRPIFGTLIALLEEDRPTLGLIDQPIARERWLGATGRPTAFNGAPARTRACPSLAHAHFATTGPNYFKPEERRALDALVGAVGGTSWGGDCYNYGLVASGHLDLVAESGLKLHDFVALVPVVEGAGGRMTDWSGGVLDRHSAGHVLAAGDPALLDAAAMMLAGNGGDCPRERAR